MKLRETLDGLLGSSLRRNTATLLSGSGVAVLITFGLQPVLSRLYSPAAFGIADAFISLVALVLPLASLKYEDAIMIPEQRREAATVLVLAATIALLTAIGVVAVAPFRRGVASFFGSPGLAKWLLLAAPAVLLYRLSELAELWMARSKKFGVASTATAARAGITGGVRVTTGIVSATSSSPAGLIAGFLAGYLGSILVILWGRVRSVLHVVSATTRGDLRDAARRYVRFPMFTLPSSLLSAGSGRLPFLLLLFYFDESTVGLFGRAFAALVVPLTLIGSAVARSFFVHASESFRAGTLADVAARVHDRMVLIAMLPFVMTVVAGPPLFEVVFGEGWALAGTYGRVCVAWFALAGITSPLTRIFDVTERQRTDFLVGAVTFTALSIAFVIGCRTGDALLAVSIGGVGGALARVVQLTVLLRIAGVGSGAALLPYIRYALYATPVAGLLFAATAYGRGIAVLIAAVLGAVVYAVLCLRELTMTKD